MPVAEQVAPTILGEWAADGGAALGVEPGGRR